MARRRASARRARSVDRRYGCRRLQPPAIRGQQDPERGAPLGVVFGRNAPAVGVHDGTDDGEAETEPLRLGGEEGLEETRQMLAGEPWPRVGDGQLDAREPVRLSADPDAPFLWEPAGPRASKLLSARFSSTCWSWMRSPLGRVAARPRGAPLDPRPRGVARRPPTSVIHVGPRPRSGTGASDSRKAAFERAPAPRVITLARAVILLADVPQDLADPGQDAEVLGIEEELGGLGIAGGSRQAAG